jgi:hypothetical protein
MTAPENDSGRRKHGIKFNEKLQLINGKNI